MPCSLEPCGGIVDRSIGGVKMTEAPLWRPGIVLKSTGPVRTPEDTPPGTKGTVGMGDGKPPGLVGILVGTTPGPVNNPVGKPSGLVGIPDGKPPGIVRIL